jgi:hypothetical protein
MEENRTALAGVMEENRSALAGVMKENRTALDTFKESKWESLFTPSNIIRIKIISS